MEKLSKRESYSNYQAASSNAKASLLMSLDSASMRNIRAEFKLRNWGLDVKTFMRVVKANSPAAGVLPHKAVWEHALCDIFLEIDTNRDGVLLWQEFTAYLVEVAGAKSSDDGRAPEPVFHYMKQTEDGTTHDYPMHSVRFFPELDKVILLEGNSAWFKVYSTELQVVKTIMAHKGPILTIEFSSKHNAIVTSSQDKTIKFWDGISFRLRHSFSVLNPVVALSCIGSLIFAADVSNDVICLTSDSGEIRRRLEGHSDVVMAIQPLLNAGALATASLDGTIRIWDYQGELLKVCLGHKESVFCLAYEPRLGVLVSGGADPIVIVWRVNNAEEETARKQQLVKKKESKRPGVGGKKAGSKKADSEVAAETTYIDRPPPLQYLNPFSASPQTGAHTTGMQFTSYSRDVSQIKLVVCNNKGEITVYATDTWMVLQRMNMVKDAGMIHGLISSLR
jgi:WD40 repeat protein